METPEAPLFRESQTFSPLLVRLIFLALAAVLIYGIIQQEVLHEPFGSKPAPTVVLVILSLVMIGLGFFLSATGLQTEITEEGILYKFTPIQQSFVFIPFHDMRTVCVRTYRPIMEYGGWGYRLGFRTRGNAVSIGGTSGIQIVRTKGSAILIGTRRANDVIEILEKLGQIKVSAKDPYVPMVRAQ